MDDQQIIDQINSLASEEHLLFNRESEGKVTPEERERLRQQYRSQRPPRGQEPPR